VGARREGTAGSRARGGPGQQAGRAADKGREGQEVRRDRELSIYPTNLLSTYLAFSVGCHVGVRLLGSIVVIWVRTQGVSPLQIAGAPRVSEVSLFGFPYFGGTIHHLAATSALKRPCLSRVYNPPCAPRRPPSRARAAWGVCAADDFRAARVVLGEEIGLDPASSAEAANAIVGARRCLPCWLLCSNWRTRPNPCTSFTPTHESPFDPGPLPAC
jgi:hypothetical protein